jgi:DNA-binding NtrC family response regulator
MKKPLNKTVLIVEDEPTLRLALHDAFESEGCEVDAVEDGNSGLEMFRKFKHDIVLTDIVMPGIDGLQLIEKIMEMERSTLIYAFTAHGNVDNAVKAMKFGIEDFISKPFRVADLVQKIRVVENLEHGEEEDLDNGPRESFDQIVGKSEPMQIIYNQIDAFADSDTNILISGESGTGKELVAAAIHYNSSRRDQPFIKVSCASLTETLLESELFGHEKGSFTGALNRKIGRFEQADGGTLFLDEIGDISETVQIKLLRVLQEREFERVGGTETINVDVRIVSATLHNLNDLVAIGRFREDLFYRINTATIELPSLANKIEDVRLLADHFCKIHASRLNKKCSGFTDQTLYMLEQYPWPGNVRELKNVVERAVLLSDDKPIETKSLPDSLRSIVKTKENAGTRIEEENNIDLTPLDEALKKSEKRHIKLALNRTGNNKTKAADILKISRKTLWEKIKLHKIEEK